MGMKKLQAWGVQVTYTSRHDQSINARYAEKFSLKPIKNFDWLGWAPLGISPDPELYVSNDWTTLKGDHFQYFYFPAELPPNDEVANLCKLCNGTHLPGTNLIGGKAYNFFVRPHLASRELL